MTCDCNLYIYILYTYPPHTHTTQHCMYNFCTSTAQHCIQLDTRTSGSSWHGRPRCWARRSCGRWCGGRRRRRRRHGNPDGCKTTSLAAESISRGSGKERDQSHRAKAARGRASIYVHLHSLGGGVLTLHAPGSSSARVLLTVTPREEAPPPSTVHRHRGLDATTLDSAEQHDALGDVLLPDM
jgi:hypothetical protein